jgi:hypothetical protein
MWGSFSRFAYRVIGLPGIHIQFSVCVCHLRVRQYQGTQVRIPRHSPHFGNSWGRCLLFIRFGTTITSSVMCTHVGMQHTYSGLLSGHSSRVPKMYDHARERPYALAHMHTPGTRVSRRSRWDHFPIVRMHTRVPFGTRITLPTTPAGKFFVRRKSRHKSHSNNVEQVTKATSLRGMSVLRDPGYPGA